jgi:hypothetical protein
MKQDNPPGMTPGAKVFVHRSEAAVTASARGQLSTAQIIGNISERDLMRAHVERSRTFQRLQLKEQEERCQRQIAEIRASLANAPAKPDL